MDIRDLPLTEQDQLCQMLDYDGSWVELGLKYMKFRGHIIQEIKMKSLNGISPSSELLNKWSVYKRTVSDLFILLGEMKHYRAMEVIKNFVDPQHHSRIKNIKDVVNNSGKVEKNLRIPSENLDRETKILNVPADSLQKTNECKNKNEDKNMCDQFSKEMNKDINRNVNTDKNKNDNTAKELISNENNESIEQIMASRMAIVVEKIKTIPHIPYEDLRRATNDWNENSALGKGGFGTVYKGIWKCIAVAIKKIGDEKNNPPGNAYNEQIKQSITELQYLNAYRHDNILPLYGYSINGPNPCLVYQYMAGGSLDYRLKDSEKVLSWKTRLNIAIGVARGLEFLHTISEKPLIHGDIKPGNILLDSCDMPRIGDFGLAKEGPQSEQTHITLEKIHGTRPYVPQEFLRGRKFSTKVDTYSFGIVLFELGTALSAYSHNRKEKLLRDHVLYYEGDILDLKDKKGDSEEGDYIFVGLINIGKWCVETKPKNRPEMLSVLIELETLVRS